MHARDLRVYSFWSTLRVLHVAVTANTHPVFPSDDDPNCKAWTCTEYATPTNPGLTCCLPRMGIREAIAMLNGTLPH